MNLGEIKTQILGNIGRLGDSSSDTETLVEGSANLAIGELNRLAMLPGVFKDLTSIPLVSGTQDYAIDADVDVLIRIAIQTSTTEGQLDPINQYDLNKRLNTSIDTGTPEFFRLFGNTAGVLNLRLYPIFQGNPAGANIIGEYIPILTDLTADGDSNVFTIKYPLSVINIATEMSYRKVVNHSSQPLQNVAIIETLLKREADKIQKREYGDGVHKTGLAVANSLRLKRGARYTQ